MRHRSNTNSHPWEARTLREAYLWQYPVCQLCRHVGLKCRPGTECVHHIWSVGSRPDRATNIITVCSEAHRFCHDSPVLGRIACVYVKVATKEFDRDAMRAIAGQDVVGWVENHYIEAEPFAELRMAILEEF